MERDAARGERVDLGAGPDLVPGPVKPFADKEFFNWDGFLVLMGVYYEKAQDHEGKLRAALMRTARDRIDGDMSKQDPGPGGWWCLRRWGVHKGASRW